MITPRPTLRVLLPVIAAAGSSSLAAAQPDVVLCQLHALTQMGADGSARTLSMATTSWNIGDADLHWSANPDPAHPFITMNIYRLSGDRFEQIGVGWTKHATVPLPTLQCDEPGLPDCVYEPGHGATGWLGRGCTDATSVSVNASGLGPRLEINPWTGGFDYSTSMFNIGGLPPDATRRLRAQDDDLNPALHPGAAYFHEARYLHADDADHMNSAAWKSFVPIRTGSGNYNFTQSGPGVMPAWGFAIDAWTDAMQTTIAEELPVVEDSSPDGRCILACKATDYGDGTWHYEYALLNVDLDRQVGSFSVPVPAGVTISNIGFHAPAHTEPFAFVGGPAIDNRAWTPSVSAGSVTWSAAANPLRWGTLYNFRFDADTAPHGADATIGLFRAAPGRPDDLTGAAQAPSAPAPLCPGDLNGDLMVDVVDLNAILGAWGQSVGVGDPRDLAGGDGVVNASDLNLILGAWGQPC